MIGPRIVKRENPGGTIYHAEPLPTEDEAAPWYMFGGAFIFSSETGSVSHPAGALL